MSQPNAIAEPAEFEFEALREAENYRSALIKDFDPYLRGNVLEVGAGVGQFTEKLQRRSNIRRLVSIELDPTFCSKFRTTFPSRELVEGTVNDLRSATDWNAIFSVNVLEHIETDREELETYSRLLRPAQGALCLFVPARPEIYAPIDKDFGHFRRYTRRELKTKLENAGFTLVRFRYFNFVGYFLWWLNFCLLKRRTFDGPSVRLFDRAIFPVVHGFESNICAPPFGQSLFVVAVAR